MPFVNADQARACWAKYHADRAAGRTPAWDCREWQEKSVKPKTRRAKDDKDDSDDSKSAEFREQAKSARDQFLIGFLHSLKMAGVPPEDVDRVAKIASEQLVKAAQLGSSSSALLDLIRSVPLGLLATGAVGTLLLPHLVGRAGGTLAAAVRNQMDQDSLDQYQFASAAREYRRRMRNLQDAQQSLRDV